MYISGKTNKYWAENQLILSLNCLQSEMLFADRFLYILLIMKWVFPDCSFPNTNLYVRHSIFGVGPLKLIHNEEQSKKQTKKNSVLSIFLWFCEDDLIFVIWHSENCNYLVVHSALRMEKKVQKICYLKYFLPHMGIFKYTWM